ncbi:MBL fold metallo-hydrolase [candidate division KSB1 bacterium]|nr:MBL fold metallo-hydrolase [candidate division KSB1 bacterium]
MIFETVVVGPLGVNCYIIGCEKSNEAAVIDPGDEIHKILNEINKNRFVLKSILLTHAHVDHLGCLLKLKEATSAAVVMHSADLPLLERSKVQAMMFGLPNPGNPRADRYVEDGELINIGELQLTAIHTPGHSPGSLTYKIDDCLFVGDLIFAGSIGRTDLPGGSFETLINSVQTKIFTLDEETKIYPGHGPMTTVGEERRFNPFF